jgi:zinc D-Ala-D-Ala carboxypeptidase
MNWDRYPNFTEAEFRCSHCGRIEMRPDFMARLQSLRLAYGKPMKITSGYRCPEHPEEVKKKAPGTHTLGCAADIAVEGTDAFELLRHAMRMGFTGIGIKQKGPGRFIHLDTHDKSPRPNVWSY